MLHNLTFKVKSHWIDSYQLVGSFRSKKFFRTHNLAKILISLRAANDGKTCLSSKGMSYGLTTKIRKLNLPENRIKTKICKDAPLNRSFISTNRQDLMSTTTAATLL